MRAALWIGSVAVASVAAVGLAMLEPSEPDRDEPSALPRELPRVPVRPVRVAPARSVEPHEARGRVLERRDAVLFGLVRSPLEAQAIAEQAAEADIAVDDLRAQFLRDVVEGKADPAAFVDAVLTVREVELEGYRETLGPERAEVMEEKLGAEP